jgi:hypothetical protein
MGWQAIEITEARKKKKRRNTEFYCKTSLRKTHFDFNNETKKEGISKHG